MRILALLVLFWSLPAMAQPIAPKLLPLGQKLEVDGKKYKCYDFGEYKQLLDIDNRLVVSLEKIKLREGLQSDLEEQVDALTEAEALLKADLNSAVAEVKIMTKKWEEENLARHQAEADKHFWSSAGLIGGSASLLVSVLVVFLGS